MGAYMRQKADAATYLQVVRSAEEKTQAKAWDDAATLWAQAVAINPTQGLSWVRLGRARYHVGQYREAILAFEKTIELGAFPDLLDHEYNYRWRVAYDIARCYALLNEHEQALAWLERALALGYRDRAAILRDDDLRSLRDDRRFQDLVGLADATLLSREAGWRDDLAFLAQEIKRIHYDPFQHTTEDAFDQMVQDLHEAIPTLTDDQIIVDLMRLVRALGDGHSTLALWELGERLPDAPVEFYLFTEGVFVTAAAPAYSQLVGAQVLALGDHSVEQVITALTQIISRDNPMWIQQNAPGLMRKPRILYAMDLIPDPGVLPVTIRDSGEIIRTVHVPAGSGPVPDPLPADWPTVLKQSGSPTPLYLQEAGHYWFEYLPDAKVLYFHYRTVRDHLDEAFEQFCDRLFASLDTNEVDKFVIDMRRNGGGNTFLHFPLFRSIARSKKLRQGTCVGYESHPLPFRLRRLRSGSLPILVMQAAQNRE